jgi:hypothetical protein
MKAPASKTITSGKKTSPSLAKKLGSTKAKSAANEQGVEKTKASKKLAPKAKPPRPRK